MVETKHLEQESDSSLSCSVLQKSKRILLLLDFFLPTSDEGSIFERAIVGGQMNQQCVL